MDRLQKSMVMGALVLVLLTGYLLKTIQGALPSPPPAAPYVVPYFPVPEQAEFCGEAAPLWNSDVRERFDREFTIVVHGHAQVFLWLKRVQRYFPWLEAELGRSGLPSDLRYVAVAESDLLPGASSPAGAVGPWQFIRTTGLNYGLVQKEGVDERRDFEKATRSAFRYLQDLHRMFGNWTLAAAAYNCGENRVMEEMKKQKGDSYYMLKLPPETERYVFRILAIKEVLAHPQKYGYYLPDGEGYREMPVDRVAISTTSALSIQALAELAGVSYREFRTLNPAYVSDMLPAGSHDLKVPASKGKAFEDRFAAFQAASPPRVTVHHVVKGETLSEIAARYGVSVADLQDWNRLKSDRAIVGQELKILK